MLLKRYRPLHEAGSGGAGRCEICWDTKLHRRVAIKHMPLRDAAGDVAGLAEARTGAMLAHPGVVSVFDFSVEGDEALLIMEAIEGPTLQELLDDLREDDEELLSLDVVAAVAQTCAEVLDFAHENGVLHLDIKPANIMVCPDGRVKVADFGVAELADAQGFGPAGGGTVGYMPPEQIRGLDLDQRCDEFALACVVYEALTCENPYAATSLKGALKVLAEPRVASVCDFRDDVDEGLDAVLLAAMNPRADARFETVLEFLDALLPELGNPKAGRAALRALVQGEDEEDEWDDEAEEDERPHRAGCFIRTLRAAALLLTLAALTLAGALALGWTPPFNLPWPVR